MNKTIYSYLKQLNSAKATQDNEEVIAVFMLLYFIEYMCIQVKCAPEFHNDIWQKNNLFSRIIASLLIIKAILKPFSPTFHV